MVPCGKCPACLARRRSDWFIRLLAEYDNSKSCIFFTLTYDEEHCPENREVVRDDITNFIRRLKRSQELEIRYLVVSEYGDTTYRPHYHGFIFNIDPKQKGLDNYQTFLQKVWDKGFVSTGLPSYSRFNYVVKYCLKPKSAFNTVAPPFMVCNRRPFIGYSFMSPQMVDTIKKNRITLIKYHGYTRPLPRIYRDKIFDSWDKWCFAKEAQDRRHDEFQKDQLIIKNKFNGDGAAYELAKFNKKVNEERIKTKYIKKQQL